MKNFNYSFLLILFVFHINSCKTTPKSSTFVWYKNEGKTAIAYKKDHKINLDGNEYSTKKLLDIINLNKIKLVDPTPKLIKTLEVEISKDSVFNSEIRMAGYKREDFVAQVIFYRISNFTYAKVYYLNKKSVEYIGIEQIENMPILGSNAEINSDFAIYKIE